jgi:hypothetical protein
MKKLLLLVLLFGILIDANSQPPLLWSKDFVAGMTNSFSNYPLIENENDTISVIGFKNTPFGQRLLIVKYDLNGDTISTMSLGNDSVINNVISDYKFDSYNHVYILQKEYLEWYKTKIVIQKYSLNGNLIWVEQIQNVADTSFLPNSLNLINDTCLFVTAYREYDYPEPGDDVIFTTSIPYVYTYNSNGNPLWERNFDPNTEISYFLHDQFSHNDTAFLFGLNSSSVKCLVRIDINNNIIVSNNLVLPGGVNDVQLTSDNKLLISPYFGYRINKANLNGSIIWSRYFGTNLPINVTGDQIISTIQDVDGNIYLTGRHFGPGYGTPSHTNNDILTIKCDNNGNQIWQNRYQYNIENADIGNIIKLKNGNVYVGGSSQRNGITSDDDYLVLKIDSASGFTNGIYRYNGISNDDDAITSIFIFDNGNVALTGLTFNGTQYDWTTQLLSDVLMSIPGFDIENNVQVFPNPILKGDLLTINGNDFSEYTLVSSIGQIVQSANLSRNENQVIRIGNIQSGIYFLHLITDKGIKSRKIIVN